MNPPAAHRLTCLRCGKPITLDVEVIGNGVRILTVCDCPKETCDDRWDALYQRIGHDVYDYLRDSESVKINEFLGR